MRHRNFGALLIAAAVAVAPALPMLPSSAAAESLRDLLPFGRTHRIAKLLPTVVNISTHKITPGKAGDGEQGPRIETFAASGFIIDPSGLIVTNRHAIDGAVDITVILQDGTALPAKVVGTGGETIDVALLKVDPPRRLPTVSWGNSDEVRVGDQVLAVGNPLGIGETVTSGIVSAKNRDIMESPFDDYIQTDAAINHGNSGGPLFNMRGYVIGVDTALYSTEANGGSVGLGFAIPGNDVQYVVDQLRQFGHLRQGWLGLRAQDMTPNIANALNLSTSYGAIIVDLDAGGPAARGGLEVGDVVLRFGKQQPKDARALARMIVTAPIGSTDPVTIWRDGKLDIIPLTVAEAPSDQPAAEAKPTGAVQKARAELPDLGLQTGPITDQVRAKYKLGTGAGGVVVTAVAPDSGALQGGLVPGDVILRVQETAISTPAEVQQSINAARDQQRRYVVMLVQRKDGLRWVPLPVSSAP
jgi:serine protease Do